MSIIKSPIYWITLFLTFSENLSPIKSLRVLCKITVTILITTPFIQFVLSKILEGIIKK
ncbi:MAG: hypothetical protein ACP5QX_06510 [Caldisericaceae bacterium]